MQDSKYSIKLYQIGKKFSKTGFRNGWYKPLLVSYYPVAMFLIFLLILLRGDFPSPRNLNCCFSMI